MILCSIVAFAFAAMAQGQGDYARMSGTVRKICRQIKAQRRHGAATNGIGRGQTICALVKADSAGRASLEEHGASIIDSIGDILIADIPLQALPEVAYARGIRRVEAEMGRHLLLDTMATVVNASQIHTAEELPQAFRGDGVVMGIMDVGFDLTHPNFCDGGMSATRIGAFWDQIAAKDEGDTLYVGREFRSESNIMAYQHSADAHLIHHGTHTLGIAAGTGTGTDYVGMAPASSLCLVSNAVTDDLQLIPDSLQYRYTYATDVLGFKYIFDYAASQGKPCVVSFSEGSAMDFRGDDVLFGEALSALLGPGRILVASAGNAGWNYNHLPKPEGVERAGAVIRSYEKKLLYTMTTTGGITLRLRTYTDPCLTIDVTDRQVCQAEDSTFYVEFSTPADNYTLSITAFPSCYNADMLAFDITLTGTRALGHAETLTIELAGADSEAHLFSLTDGFQLSASDPDYACAKAEYNVNSPSCMEDVICVGATSWRKGWADEDGDWHTSDYGSGGERAPYSSVGPTFDGRVKPDVLAPGSNIISSGSSFYMLGDKYDPDYTVDRLIHNGKEYPWVVMSGTSMSAPAVGGIIALWLQANPELSPADVKSILSATCRRIGTATEQSDNLCGYGSIDAYAGLLAALGLNGIENLPQRQPQGARIAAERGRGVSLVFTEPIAEEVVVRVYSVSGEMVKTACFERGTSSATIEMPPHASGVYAVSLRSLERNLCGSSLVRL